MRKEILDRRFWCIKLIGDWEIHFKLRQYTSDMRFVATAYRTVPIMSFGFLRDRREKTAFILEQLEIDMHKQLDEYLIEQGLVND